MLYRIITTTHDGKSYESVRRFNQFVEFRDKLNALFHLAGMQRNIKIVREIFPSSKRWKLNKLEPGFLEVRREALEDFLRELLTLPQMKDW